MICAQQQLQCRLRLAAESTVNGRCARLIASCRSWMELVVASFVDPVYRSHLVLSCHRVGAPAIDRPGGRGGAALLAACVRWLSFDCRDVLYVMSPPWFLPVWSLLLLLLLLLLLTAVTCAGRTPRWCFRSLRCAVNCLSYSQMRCPKLQNTDLHIGLHTLAKSDKNAIKGNRRL